MSAVTRKRSPAYGVLRRIITAVVYAQQRQTERDVARYVLQLGCKLTDDAERRLMQRLLCNCSFSSTASERGEIWPRHH